MLNFGELEDHQVGLPTSSSLLQGGLGQSVGDHLSVKQIDDYKGNQNLMMVVCNSSFPSLIVKL